MIISLLSQKGGVGKTTLAIHLAAALVEMGSRVLLIDADPQASATDWSARRSDDPLFPVVGMAKATLHKDLPAVADSSDHVVIDGPPRVNDVSRSAILASDVVIIPVCPSPYDVWAAEDVITLVREARVFKESLCVRFVINRKIANTVIGRDVLAALDRFEYPVLPVSVCQRVIFAESAAAGRTVLEVNPNSKASREILALRDAILEVPIDDGVAT